MGALPKRKISKARKGRRRGAIRLKPPQLTSCPHCGQPRRPHVVCPYCGFYKEKKVLKTKNKKNEKSR